MKDRQKYKIALEANFARLLVIALSALFLSISALMFSAYLIWRQFQSPFISLLIFLMLSLGLLSGLLLLWIVRVASLNGPVLVVDEKGIRDSVSLFNAGWIPHTNLRRLRLVELLGMDLLEIRIKHRSSTVHNLREKLGPIFGFFAILFGHKIFIPISFMKTNRLDLETRLIHYSLTRLEDRPVEATSSPIEKIELETPPPLTTFEVLFEQPEPEPDESRTSTRSNSYSVNPDDNTVIRRVKAIKARVVKTALDRAICDFYFEEVRNYPQWSERGDVRLPIQLKFISGQVDFTSLEQVCFELEGDRFLFALRRDLEEHGDEALLSVAVNDQLVMILKVRVEIGALEPLDVEQYLEGAWVLSLQSLIDSIKMRRLKETNLRLATGEETNPGGELSSTDPEELAKLKSKFGLK